MRRQRDVLRQAGIHASGVTGSEEEEEYEEELCPMLTEFKQQQEEHNNNNTTTTTANDGEDYLPFPGHIGVSEWLLSAQHHPSFMQFPFSPLCPSSPPPASTTTTTTKTTATPLPPPIAFKKKPPPTPPSPLALPTLLCNIQNSLRTIATVQLEYERTTQFLLTENNDLRWRQVERQALVDEIREQERSAATKRFEVVERNLQAIIQQQDALLRALKLFAVSAMPSTTTPTAAAAAL